MKPEEFTFISCHGFRSAAGSAVVSGFSGVRGSGLAAAARSRPACSARCGSAEPTRSSFARSTHPEFALPARLGFFKLVGVIGATSLGFVDAGVLGPKPGNDSGFGTGLARKTARKTTSKYATICYS